MVRRITNGSVRVRRNDNSYTSVQGGVMRQRSLAVPSNITITRHLSDSVVFIIPGGDLSFTQSSLAALDVILWCHRDARSCSDHIYPAGSHGLRAGARHPAAECHL